MLPRMASPGARPILVGRNAFFCSCCSSLATGDDHSPCAPHQPSRTPRLSTCLHPSQPPSSGRRTRAIDSIPCCARQCLPSRGSSIPHQCRQEQRRPQRRSIRLLGRSRQACVQLQDAHHPADRPLHSTLVQRSTPRPFADTPPAVVRSSDGRSAAPACMLHADRGRAVPQVRHGRLLVCAQPNRVRGRAGRKVGGKEQKFGMEADLGVEQQERVVGRSGFQQATRGTSFLSSPPFSKVTLPPPLFLFPMPFELACLRPKLTPLESLHLCAALRSERAPAGSAGTSPTGVRRRRRRRPRCWLSSPSRPMRKSRRRASRILPSRSEGIGSG